MNTSTEIEAPVIKEISERRSRRAYSAQAVSAQTIHSLFEAARWAPSSVNEQPWIYVYATKDQPELWNKLFEPLNDTNKVWAKDAPLLVLSLSRKTFTRNGRFNGSAQYDLGAANAFLSLQATALGLNVHQIGGYDRQKAVELLNVPDTFEPGVVLAIGYPGDPELLPEPLKQRELSPRERQRRESFVKNSSF
ncbi:MAG: nitroreductase family protein [Bacteroidota bacterium]